jgi:signal transduction histidine kinase
MDGLVPVGRREARPRDRRRLVLRLLREPLRRRTWSELAYVLVSLPVAVAGFLFTVVATMLSVVSVVVLAGALLIELCSAGAQAFAVVNRNLARRLPGAQVMPVPLPPQPGLVGRLWSGIADPATWRTRAYLMLKLPIVVAGLVAASYVWVIGLVGVTYPLRSLILSGTPTATPIPYFGLNALDGDLLVAPLGLALVVTAPWLTRAVVGADRVLMTRLTGPEAALTERVRDLEQARAHAVDDSAARLRRIERDLHDGAQAQMIAVTMKLGLAREDLSGTSGVSDASDASLRSARELVEAAHGIAREAVTGLRDLARGIHPPVLDRGLDAALATLAARSAVPVTLVTDLPERASPAIEATAYFCAAELLTNVAKHSRARHAAVEAVHLPGLLRLRVSDDGIGGARAGRGSGLDGLSERLSTVDGGLTISSPPDGPTVITVELPSRA